MYSTWKNNIHTQSTHNSVVCVCRVKSVVVISIIDILARSRRTIRNLLGNQIYVSLLWWFSFIQIGSSRVPADGKGRNKVIGIFLSLRVNDGDGGANFSAHLKLRKFRGPEVSVCCHCSMTEGGHIAERERETVARIRNNGEIPEIMLCWPGKQCDNRK